MNCKQLPYLLIKTVITTRTTTMTQTTLTLLNTTLTITIQILSLITNVQLNSRMDLTKMKIISLILQMNSNNNNITALIHMALI